MGAQNGSEAISAYVERSLSMHRSPSVTNVTYLFRYCTLCCKLGGSIMKKTYLYATIRLVFLALFFVLVVTKRFQLWLVLYLAGVILSLFFGRIYCGYICPMNTVMRHVQR